MRLRFLALRASFERPRVHWHLGLSLKCSDIDNWHQFTELALNLIPRIIYLDTGYANMTITDHGDTNFVKRFIIYIDGSAAETGQQTSASWGFIVLAETHQGQIQIIGFRGGKVQTDQAHAEYVGA